MRIPIAAMEKPMNKKYAGKSEVGRQALAMLKKAGTVKEYERCATLFTDAISMNPNKANYYFSRGKCFLALHQYQRALFGTAILCSC